MSTCELPAKTSPIGVEKMGRDSLVISIAACNSGCSKIVIHPKIMDSFRGSWSHNSNCYELML